MPNITAPTSSSTSAGQDSSALLKYIVWLAIPVLLLGGGFAADRLARQMELAAATEQQARIAEFALADQNAVRSAVTLMEESLAALQAFQKQDPTNQSGLLQGLAENALQRNRALRMIAEVQLQQAPQASAANPASGASFTERNSGAQLPILQRDWLGKLVPAGANSSWLVLQKLILAPSLSDAEKQTYQSQLGLDLQSEPEWMAALQTGTLAVSYRSLDKGYALVLMPYLQDGNIQSAILAELSIEQLLGKDAGSGTAQQSVARIFDASENTGLKLVFPSAKTILEKELTNSHLLDKVKARRQSEIQGLGRKWMVESEPRAQFFANTEQNSSQYFRYGGLLASALAAYLLYNLLTRNSRIERLVNQRGVELEHAYNQLRDSELMTMQNEKMSSLGQMVAGVAHEINTPLAYATSNVELLKERMQTIESAFNDQNQLLDVLNRWQELDQSARNAWYQQALARLQQLQKLRTKTLSKSGVLLDESMDGLNRVRDLVATLKDFSRVDRAAVDHVDLHHCIESTLKIATNVIKHKADVVREFGELPSVRCNPSQINQVLLNLITNAAQAIPEYGQITIRTQALDAERVQIEVIDNGKGMSPEVQAKVFQPFFTTKGSGEGTGLGLAISDKIIKAHNGELSVHSVLGKGSVFTIVLPVHQQLNQAEPFDDQLAA